MTMVVREERAVPRAARAPSGRTLPPPVWEDWDDERLLDLRLSQLDLSIEGTPLESRIGETFRELEERGIVFRPHCWLSDEWFCPDGVAGIAIPFYLAHPRLATLEGSQMLEVEGGTPDECRRILRHEVGHALENAYRLRLRKKRRELFGSTTVPYPEYYAPRPYSKSYVIHLDAWYAQSHPDEDFAETFAVWLTPGSDWRQRYEGWPALRKLEYIDELMREIGPKEPPALVPRTPDALPSLRRSLREHYRRKREHYGVEHPHFYDRDLRRLFSDAPEYAKNPSAARFLTRFGPQARRRVGRWTGVYQYTIDQVLGNMITRCRELNLRLIRPEDETRLEFNVLLTVQTMNYLHTGRHRLAL